MSHDLTLFRLARPKRNPLAHAIGQTLVALSLAGSLASTSAIAADQAKVERKSWQIPAGSLENALTSFGREAGILLSFGSDITSGVKTQGVNGSYSTAEALQQLLAGTDIEAAPQAKGGYSLKKQSSTATSSGKLAVVKVTAQADEQDGYAAKRSTTATKTDTPLRDVPQAITVITSEQVRDQGVQGLADAVRFIPGLNMSQGEGNRDTAIFRGNSSTGDFFLDGIRDDVQYIRDLYNIERVEVLKGSNAMIFGRGGSGGVINRATKQANWDNEREVSVTGGSWNNRRITTDIDQGFNDDVAGRVTALYENSESYRDGFELERYGINPTVTFNLGADTLASVGYEYFKDDRVADRGIPSWKGEPLKVDSSEFFGDASASEVIAEANILSALVEHEFNSNVQLRNRTRVADYDKFYQNIFPGAINTAAVGANAPGTLVTISAYSNATQRKNIFNQTDVIFNLETGSIKHTLLTGVELGKQDTDNFRETGYFTNPTNASLAQVTSVQVPLTSRFATPVAFRQSATDANNTGSAKVAALYIQDQIEFIPQLQAVLGLRYDHLKTEVTNNRSGDNFEVSDNLLSPRIGLIYKPIEPVSVYTSYSLAYVPRAGDQLASLSLSNQALDPEKFTSLELGAKWDITDRLAGTVAVYKLTRSDVAVVNPEAPTELILASGDSQRTQGIELELAGKVTDAWSITAGYAHQDAEILKELKTSATSTTLAGSTLANVPDQTISLWNRYDFNQHWGVGLGVINRSEVYTSIDNKVTVPDFTRLDAAAFYQISQNFQVQVNIENLSDEDYYVSANSNDNITPGSPLAVRVGLTAKF